MVCEHISDVSAQKDLTRLARAAEAALASSDRPILGLGIESTLKCMNSRCMFPNSQRMYICIRCTHSSCHSMRSTNRALSQSQSDSNCDTDEQSHLQRHCTLSGHFVFLSVEHMHLYCARCDDFIFDRYLDAVIAVKARAARAGRARLTSTQSPLEATLHEMMLPDRDLPQKMRKRRRLLNNNNWIPSDRELQRITTRSRVFLSSGLQTKPPIGLVNLGNSCYMNSVLQAFLNAPPLRQYFLADEHRPFCTMNKASECLACAIDRIICDSCFGPKLSEEKWSESSLNSGLKVPFVVPRHILDIMWRNAPHLASYAQHDAHEFLIAALNVLNTHCRADKSTTNTRTESSSKESESNKTAKRTGLHPDPRRNASPVSPLSNVRAEHGGVLFGQSKPLARSATSIVQSLFSGTLQSDVICQVCGNSSLTLEKFYEISLDVDKLVKGSSAKRSRAQSPTCGTPAVESLPSAVNAIQEKSNEDYITSQMKEDSAEPSISYDHTTINDSPTETLRGAYDSHQERDTDPTNSLEDCLSRFTEPELLGSSSKMHCTQCGTRQESMKQMSIRTLPPIICFHFKRFEQSFANVRRSEMIKINTPVEFPADGMDLSQFQTSAVLRRRQGTRAMANFSTVHSALLAALRSKMSDKNFETDSYNSHTVRGNRDTIYDLFAVVNHNGRIDSGHYTALIRKRGYWFKCDDEKVIKLPTMERVIRSEEAYLVFYAQRHPNVQASPL